MIVTLINNAKGGYADRIETRDGTLLKELLENESISDENVKVRVNGAAVPEDAVLNDGDRVTIAPIGLKGA